MTEMHDTNSLEYELARVLNKYSKENESDTPDWILAQYLLKCLEAWFDFKPWNHNKTDQALKERNDFYKKV